MTIEIPSNEAIKSEITRLNEALLLIRENASSQGLNEANLAEPDRVDDLKDDLTPSGFWNHYIGGGIASIASLPSDMADLIPPVQKRLHTLTERYMIHPVGSNDELNIATCRAFLGGGFSFDWTQSSALLDILRNTVADLGDQYSLREGRMPLGYSH